MDGGVEKKGYIGLDIGGTKCAAVYSLYDGVPEIKDKIKFTTAEYTPNECLALFADFISLHIGEGIEAIGISCGGPLDSNRGVIMSPPNLPGWDDIAVVSYFEKKFHIPTYLQNDANACAVAEWKFGAGRGTRNMIFLTFGTGLGAGIVADGKLYVGANDNAGEIGHVRLTRSGPLGYRKIGSCEGYCSGNGIAELAKLMCREKRYRESSAVAVAAAKGEENFTAKLLADLAEKGDAFSRAVYARSGEMLGRTLSMLVDILNPEKIVIGGVFMRSKELLLPYAIRVMRRECLPYAFDAVEILSAELGEKIGDYSAIAVAVCGNEGSEV